MNSDPRDNIATDLFYKIRSRFTGLKLGTETGEITIIPEEARFFDFDYTINNKKVGHVTMSIAEPNSIKVYFSNDITKNMKDNQKNDWYSFLREMRVFAKRRLLNFDTRDIIKDNLDRRDYAFLSKTSKKEDTQESVQYKKRSPMIESKLYGNKTTSFQTLGDAKLIIKHTAPLQNENATGARTRQIHSIFIENAVGEKFKYPNKYLTGARAMLRHVANNGTPYDQIGESIVSMTDELFQLRTFKNYVNRNGLVNETTSAIIDKSSEKINELKSTLSGLSKQKHYENYKNNFSQKTNNDIPQEVIETFTEQFTIRNFNENIKAVFPLLYNLMKENQEQSGCEPKMKHKKSEPKKQKKPNTQPKEIEQFESWVMEEHPQNSIMSDDVAEKDAAVEELKEFMSRPIEAGVNGVNAMETLKGIIDDDKLHDTFRRLSNEDTTKDCRSAVVSWLKENVPDVYVEFESKHKKKAKKLDELAPVAAAAALGGKALKAGAAAGKALKAGAAASKAGAAAGKAAKTGAVIGAANALSKSEKEKQSNSDSTQKENFNQPQGSVNVQQLAEFIHSFYDKESRTFPKGPTSVCSMAGKKYGEHAEKACYEFVERYCPTNQTQIIDEETEQLDEAFFIPALITGAKYAATTAASYGAQVLLKRALKKQGSSKVRAAVEGVKRARGGRSRAQGQRTGSVRSAADGVANVGRATGSAFLGITAYEIVQLVKSAYHTVKELAKAILSSEEFRQLMTFTRKYKVPILIGIAILYGSRKFRNWLKDRQDRDETSESINIFSNEFAELHEIKQLAGV